MENQNNNSEQQTINIQIPNTDNIANKRFIIPSSFTIAIILFFFTFCVFSCGNQKIGSVTGIDLVTGSELKTQDMISGRQTKGKDIPASIWAIIAFSSAIIGLGAFLIKEKREALIGTSAGVIGTVSLIILNFVVKSAVDSEFQGQVEANFQFPYWGALIAMGVAGIISYLRLLKTNKIVVNISPPTSTTTPLTESVSQQQATVSSNPQESSFDIIKWLKNIIEIFTVWFYKQTTPVKTESQKTPYIKTDNSNFVNKVEEKTIVEDNIKINEDLKTKEEETQKKSAETTLKKEVKPKSKIKKFIIIPLLIFLAIIILSIGGSYLAWVISSPLNKTKSKVEHYLSTKTSMGIYNFFFNTLRLKKYCKSIEKKQDALPDYFTNNYTGTLGSSSIELKLIRQKGKLSGSYKQLKKMYSLDGTIDNKGKFYMSESLNGNPSGNWKGDISKENIVGNWSKYLKNQKGTLFLKIK